MESNDTEFKCAVCFTNNDKSVVNPEYCKHTICFKCYTNLILREKTVAKCPECRTPFMKPEDIVAQTDNTVLRLSRHITLHAERAISDLEYEEIFNSIYHDRTNRIQSEQVKEEQEEENEFPPLPDNFDFDLYSQSVLGT